MAPKRIQHAASPLIFDGGRPSKVSSLRQEVSASSGVGDPAESAFALDSADARKPQLASPKLFIRSGNSMMGALLNLFFLLLVILGSVLCVFGPVTVLGVMFWKWHKELAESVRLRQARSTQVR